MYCGINQNDCSYTLVIAGEDKKQTSNDTKNERCPILHESLSFFFTQNLLFIPLYSFGVGKKHKTGPLVARNFPVEYFMTQGPKMIAIETLEIAELNLLQSILEIRPEDILKQILPEINNIMWILGHCFAHFDMVLCGRCQEKELFSESVAHYFRYGTTKKEIIETGPPLSFANLIDEYLKISESGFAYLHSLEDQDFDKIIFPENGDNLLQSIQRIALHYMGHVGQIVLIRQALGNPGPTFVGGISAISRSESKENWHSWWSEKKPLFL